MGVERYRSFDEARRALWLDAGDAAILERMQRLGQLGRLVKRPHGVSRYRTIEEAKAEKRPART